MKNVILGIIVIGLVLFLAQKVLNTPSRSVESFVLETGTYCFASQLPSEFVPTESEYDYKFLKFDVDGKIITGSIETYPYGIDSAQGVLSGEIISMDEREAIIEALDYYESEGMIGTRERRVEIRDNTAHVAYGTIDEQTGKLGWWTIPQVSCQEYHGLYQKFN